MFETIIVKALVSAALVATLASSGYAVYTKIKDIGYKEAEAVYTLKLKEYEDTVLEKVTKVEEMSTSLIEETSKSNAKLTKDITLIVKGFKGQPMTIINQKGECIPSPTFSEGFGKINKRVNESIKDTSK